MSQGDPAAPAVQAAIDTLSGTTVAVLTGAGMSTDSGIPDYRGPDSPPRRPMTVQQFLGDVTFRRHYWARNSVGWRHVHATTPNGGHRAMATLEAGGVVAGIITQNVDRLHSRAGNRNVIDLHGNYLHIVCMSCGARVDRESLHDRLRILNTAFFDDDGVAKAVGDVEIAPDADAVLASTEGFVIADCERCGGILKPDIVYFGETVPRERVEAAYALVDSVEVLLVAGTSLTVQSGLRFVRRAHQTGKPIVIVNRGVTRGDTMATVKVDAGCTPTLRAFARHLVPSAARLPA